MKVERIGNATLYLGDCLKVMPTLADVDAVVTDPPYGQGYIANFSGQHGNLSSPPPDVGKRVIADRVTGDDKPFDPSPLLSKAPDLIIWGAHRFSNALPPGQWLVWDKRPGMAPNDLGDAEAAWRNRIGAMKMFRYLWSGLTLQAGAPEAERQPGTSAQVRRVHPTQKPIALMEWCIGFLPNSNVILDPYMGSGTTGVACMKLGRKFIGIEIESEYFNIACERIDNAQRQEKLFGGVSADVLANTYHGPHDE